MTRFPSLFTVSTCVYADVYFRLLFLIKLGQSLIWNVEIFVIGLSLYFFILCFSSVGYNLCFSSVSYSLYEAICAHRL